jgi:hypothetical protein
VLSILASFGVSLAVLQQPRRILRLHQSLTLRTLPSMGFAPRCHSPPDRHATFQVCQNRISPSHKSSVLLKIRCDVDEYEEVRASLKTSRGTIGSPAERASSRPSTTVDPQRVVQNCPSAKCQIAVRYDRRTWRQATDTQSVKDTRAETVRCPYRRYLIALTRRSTDAGDQVGRV